MNFIALDAFPLAEARQRSPHAKITASIPRVNEEIYRALLFAERADWQVTTYSGRPLQVLEDEASAFQSGRFVKKQLPELPLLPTANRFSTLPLNQFLRDRIYPKILGDRYQLAFYTHHNLTPWGLAPCAKKEIWTALDFYPFKQNPREMRHYLKRLIKGRGQLAALCISEDTARDAREFLELPEERIRVAHLGVDHATFKPLGDSDGELLAPLAVPHSEPFALYVGAWFGRKNLRSLLRALVELREQSQIGMPLVVAGSRGRPFSAEETAEVVNLMKHSRIRVAYLPGLSDEQLAALYRQAKMLVHPSKFEGFGLTILEAMACGCPVICGSGGALAEVAADCSLHLKDVESIEEIAAGIKRVLENEAVANALRLKGISHAAKFTWERFHAKTVQLVEECLDD